MTKIGILTLPVGLNYGGILQAFVLQHVLREMGYQPLILNRAYPKYRLMASEVWGLFQYLLGQRSKPRIWPNAREREKMTRFTSQFIKQHIAVSSPIRSSNGLKEVLNKENISSLIVGSDQVWRKGYSVSTSNFFLDFASHRNDIKKIAYAASFGVDKWEFNPSNTKRYKQLAKLFDAISVREESAVVMCGKYLDVEACHVLDPTMLVDKSVYKGLALSPITTPSSGNLFCYLLDRTPQKMSLINQIAKEKSLIPFEILPKTYTEIKSTRELEDCALPPVEQWLRSFLDAEYVVTDSFHGTVFSILFNKPFVVIGNKFRGMARFESLLDFFGLEERFLPENDFSGYRHLIEKQIDYATIENTLNNNRNESLNFLRHNLNKRL